MAERGEMESLFHHVRKTDLHPGSAAVKDPPFESFDVVLRRDYEALQARLSRIADETRDHPGLGLLHHIAIGTHDGALR